MTAGGSDSGTITTHVIAKDTFNRSVSSGFGTADLGGIYTNPNPANSGTYVSAGKAIIGGLQPGKSFGAWLPGASAKDELSQIDLTLPTIDSQKSGLYVALETRHQSDGRAYRGKIYIDANGKAALNISRTATGSTETGLGDAALPFAVRSGETLTVQTQVVGTNPTRVSVRAFPAGTTAPAWQLGVSDASTAQVTAAGSVGEWGHMSTAGTSRPFALSAFQAWELGTAPVTTPPTSSAAPSTSAATSSAAPSTSATKTTAPSTTKASSTAPSTTSPAPTSTPPVTPPSSGSVGSVAVGAAQYAVPSGAVFVSPSGSDSAAGSQSAPLRTVQAAVNKAAAGGTVVVRAGTYHETVSITKANLTVQAYPGEAVWFDGSSVVSGWTKSGSSWVHSGWTNEFDHSASFTTGKNDASFIDPAYPLAAWPDQTFVNGTELDQVSKANAAGTFAVDYSANTLTLGSDPAGKEVRSSDLAKAFLVTGNGVTLQGFGVRRYGTPVPMMGAILLYGGSDTARNLVVSDNASQSLSLMKANNKVDHLSISDSGMTGIHGNEADNTLISNTYITGSNREHFKRSPTCGGIKITRSVGITIVNNSTVDNNSTGIWLDESVRNFTIANNTSTGNTKGMTLELSDTGIVANNKVVGGEYGILIMDTGNVRVFNNSVKAATSREIAFIQDARRQAASGAVGRDPRMPVPDPSCPWLLRNITLANNVLDTTGTYQLMVQDQQTNIPADKMNLSINGNLFTARSGNSAMPVAWGQSDNRTMTMYPVVSDFDSAKGMKNLQTAASSAAKKASVSSIDASAVPLPADVAKVIGVPTGTKKIGTFN
ncbi:right-handed parallel beta-helix repeat-containing protein [Jatrophihabitans telluris]|uniref:Right-handed parallel beta-helix repeat-containing protein n=1 Tax=Jatrophihabitans telluris TaxID=2038343 RepID=A0ABY4R214_9ACTN|nr:right-handed parallel beta-helix repeat-containing protein [Jatrophihabitans telluris]UQX89367.1 right-handed parallel beta-helix repeat-containing protein [Jatrophihabitans telluris]